MFLITADIPANACRTKPFSVLNPDVAVYQSAPSSDAMPIGLFNSLNMSDPSPSQRLNLIRDISYDDPKAARFARFFRRLEAMEGVNSNWDSYGAEPPNGKALYWAKTVLKVLLHTNFLPSRVSPSVENGVVVSFMSESKYADIECFNNGTIVAVTSDGSGQANVWNVAMNQEDIEHAVDYIRSFLET